MSDKINDGGPAFPLPFVYDPDRGESGMYIDANDAGVPCGMTLRDWFAGQAMAAFIQSDTTEFTSRAQALDALRGNAAGAYRMADFMLAARNNTHT